MFTQEDTAERYAGSTPLQPVRPKGTACASLHPERMPVWASDGLEKGYATLTQELPAPDAGPYASASMAPDRSCDIESVPSADLAYAPSTTATPIPDTGLAASASNPLPLREEDTMPQPIATAPMQGAPIANGPQAAPQATSQSATAALRADALDSFIFDVLEEGERRFGLTMLQSEIIRLTALGLNARSIALIKNLTDRASRKLAS